MAKNIILCFDGTSNEPADAVQERTKFGLGEAEDSSISNVLKLHLLLGGDLRGNHTINGQESYYFSGVGTYGNKIQRAFNAALAPESEDVGRIIKNGIRTLREKLSNKDKLFIFGFSRGAAIARRFASVLPIYFPKKVPEVSFLGVFDTVASFGIPNLNSSEKPVSDVIFEDNYIAPCIKKALHIVSLDDKRKAFQPTLMNVDPRVEEIWFAGAHSDIGGGYRKDGLSDSSLEYMLEKLRGSGLEVKHPAQIDYAGLVPPHAGYTIDYGDVMIKPEPISGKSHQQRRPPLTSRLTLNDRLLRVNIDDQPVDPAMHPPRVHHSVALRIHGREAYKPASLIHTNHLLVMPDGSTEAFDGLHDHRALGRLPKIVLRSGEERLVRVYANKLYNQSGVILEKGGKYTFNCSLEQRWHDASIAATAKGWTVEQADLGFLQGLYIKYKEDDRRVPKAKWFELVAAIDTSDEHAFRLMQYTTKAYTAKARGEFCPFANDLASRYGNNLGFVDVIIKRL